MKTTQSIIDEVLKNWGNYKTQEEDVSEPYAEEYTRKKTVWGGITEWDNPNVLWLLLEHENGGYDGSGNQVGLTREGKIVWEYQSHCSCYGFQDSKQHDGELCLGCDKDPKRYELNMVPEQWEAIIRYNMEVILDNKK